MLKNVCVASITLVETSQLDELEYEKFENNTHVTNAMKYLSGFESRFP